MSAYFSLEQQMLWGFSPLSTLNFLPRRGNPYFINQLQLPSVFHCAVLNYELEECLD